VNDVTHVCSKGWSARCAKAKGKKCMCACGGRNHGGIKQNGGTLEVTDISKIPDSPFEIRDGYDIVLTRTLLGANVNVPHKIVYHSPTGFEWGYPGSGPSDLSLNILAIFIPDNWAMKLHQQFKEDFIASMPMLGGTIKTETIKNWILSHKDEDVK
jgi:hypothetical protein